MNIQVSKILNFETLLRGPLFTLLRRKLRTLRAEACNFTKVTLLHECLSCLSNCTDDIKSRKASHMQKVYHTSRFAKPYSRESLCTHATCGSHIFRQNRTKHKNHVFLKNTAIQPLRSIYTVISPNISWKTLCCLESFRKFLKVKPDLTNRNTEGK